MQNTPTKIVRVQRVAYWTALTLLAFVAGIYGAGHWILILALPATLVERRLWPETAR